MDQDSDKNVRPSAVNKSTMSELRAKIIWPKKEIREALPSIPPERVAQQRHREWAEREEGWTGGDKK
jgi:hypothetical protein